MEPKFALKDNVHVIGFTSPTSTGTVEGIEPGDVDMGEAAYYYAVDFHDGEATFFAEDEIRLATEQELAERIYLS